MDSNNSHYSAGLPRRPSLGPTLSLQPYHPITHAHAHAHVQYPTSPPATDDGQLDSSIAVDRARMKEVNCDREDRSRLANMNMPSNLVGQAVTPYLKEHVPTLYSPFTKIISSHTHQPVPKDFNSKFCYRHRPDSKCRKSADEDKMAKIQSVSRCPPFVYYLCALGH